MKKTLLAVALLAAGPGAFAQTAPKAVAKSSGARVDGCAGMAAAKCDKSMASGTASLAEMPACCRARMAAAKATPTTTASAAKPVVKSL